jgi:hypothetical protein
MNNDLFASCDWLLSQNNRGYGTLPIPQPRDSEISTLSRQSKRQPSTPRAIRPNLLRAWIALDEVARKQSALEISDEQRPTLLAYSERMASLAVRERNQEFIILTHPRQHVEDDADGQNELRCDPKERVEENLTGQRQGEPSAVKRWHRLA